MCETDPMVAGEQRRCRSMVVTLFQGCRCVPFPDSLALAAVGSNHVELVAGAETAGWLGPNRPMSQSAGPQVRKVACLGRGLPSTCFQVQQHPSPV